MRPSIVFLLASTLYFFTRSPALDEWDSVQFAMGATRGFNLFQHQPHPPGYPLYVLAGWLGTRVFGLDVLTALELAAALGGGLFVAAWFTLARRATGGDGGGDNVRLAGLFAVGLTVLPITWLTATKALSDAPAAGLLALELLGAAVFRERRTFGPLAWTALAGAAATGVRPQNFAVTALILALALADRRSVRRFRRLTQIGSETPEPTSDYHLRKSAQSTDKPNRAWRWRWSAGFGLFIAGCLVWLVPTMILQARCPEAGGSVWTYPRQLWTQWTWRLDQPKAFVGATGQTGEALALRLWLHFGGWFTRGFAFAENIAVGAVGFVLLLGGWWLAWRQRRPAVFLACFWREHRIWAAVYVGIIFTCLPPDQRYYLPIFPLLLLPAMAGWTWGSAADAGPRRWAVTAALALPALGLALALPLVWEGHTQAAPPVRLVRWLDERYPTSAERPAVWLIFRDTRRHAQWYGPGFRVEWSPYFPPPSRWPEDWRAAQAIYTDDPAVVADTPPAPGWTWREVGQWHRSPLIYRKHNAVTFWQLDAPAATTVGSATPP